MARINAIINVSILLEAAQKIQSKTNGLVCPPVPSRNDMNGNYNCWNFVARACGWVEHEYWMDENEMNRYLAQNTAEVEKHFIQEGDIVVYRSPGERRWFEDQPKGRLYHAALLVDPRSGLVLEKAGRHEVEIVGPDSFYPGDITFRRVIKHDTQKELF